MVKVVDLVVDSNHGPRRCRPLKTPLLHPLLIPASKPLLAFTIANEWETAHTIAEARSSFRMPLTQMSSRIIDIEHTKDDREREGMVEEIREHCLRYLETDTLLFLAPSGGVVSKAAGERTLRECQEEALTPVLEFLTTQVWPGVTIKAVDGNEGILPLSYKQPKETLETIKRWVEGLGLWDLLALERATVAGKSFLMGARVVSGWSESGLMVGREGTVVQRREVGVEEAARAVSVEVVWQTGQWGEVEDTHDVEKEDLRRQLGSAILLCTGVGLK
ncbi:hypothetical protein BJ508DRAFT_368869 [Ascobolus immersus RN42]|uniref:ATP12-domain-containing protein n=1 Tax=Ascobolus immersus RN42 TaxID=1160509 RepID=A0A3N4IKB8_ASCIM|nr:hypothetical protein BJ508DRAFT_368869 [Ascobolus immersus RN42]